jgi:S-adenosylmethionine decarboxylase
MGWRWWWAQVMAVQHQPAGAHLLADMHGISADKLKDAAMLEDLLRHSAQAAGAQVLFSHFHSFGVGQGITGVVLLAESHISIHTWPEYGFAAADIFMCGQAQPQLALEVIKLALRPASCEVQTVKRGLNMQATLCNRVYS